MPKLTPSTNKRGMGLDVVISLKRARGRPRGSRKIDVGQGDLFPAEKLYEQYPAQLRGLLDMFKIAKSIKLTPAGEEFLKVKP